MKERRPLGRTAGRALGVFTLAVAMLGGSALTAQAYVPQSGIVYQLDPNQPCLKGRGNCAIYPKSAQLPSGRIVAAFEESIVAPSGGAAGQDMPVYSSDDDGDSWQPLSRVGAPASLSSDPQYAEYTSNWTNPYLYVLPQAVGDLAAGTLLLATVVSGEDEYYREQKAADPNWLPNNDGDRRDVGIALYASTDEGATWSIRSIVAAGGWQGGSAGAKGQNIATANTNRQVDPVWEPHLIVRDGKLVVFYSDENDYLGFDATTGVAIPDPANATAPDSIGQILAHRTWDGRASSSWGPITVDAAGFTEDRGNGKTQIGGGRPGMTTVAPTTDGKWFLTFEYFGGGDDVRYKVADDPLRFFADGDPDGQNISALPKAPGSRVHARGGSPVLVTLPDGRILYNGSNSGNIWVNESGRSDGAWTEYQTPLGGGYSRNLQYVQGTGRVVILQATWGGPGTQATIRHGEVDLGDSQGAYYQLVNRKTGQILGTGGNDNDDNIGNADTPSVASEAASAAVGDSQYWHLTEKSGGAYTLLNKAGGREAAIWGGGASSGQRLGLWVDNTAPGLWNLVPATDGSVRFQSTRNTSLYLSGASASSPVTLQPSATDGSQDWTLVQLAPTASALTTATRSERLIGTDQVAPGAAVALDATATNRAGTARHAGVDGHAYALVGDAVTDLGVVAFDSSQRGSITLPASLTGGTTARIAVAFDSGPLVWDTMTVRDPATLPLTTTATSRCVAGKVVLTTIVSNGSASNVDVTVNSAYGSKTTAAVKPGSNTSSAFTTRLTTIPAGQVTITGTGVVSGETVTTTSTTAYPARTC
ncbi:hypothetical protein GRS96_19025 (plasmid) [Rathayibacter sp. VKM Ac-2803]|uniref:Ricin B lectin domain-containing protein n=1 Tax=Rathayibacter caricis DSM 15933 TaxID=1328867 RepID=A0A2T4UPD3_9MICO|nr:MULTISPECIES: RICIN domain-containing protein [Rathayibacter]MWV51369.1 hypothetical protein [Rathayibacter sp. VKM Ac-2803]PTL71379.1 hypothetical protein C1I63_18330 [Rathayibacter caricis DSM 15933]